MGFDCLKHIQGTFDIYPLHSRRCGQGYRPATKGNLGARWGPAGHGEPHLPAGMVGDIADWIQRLLGGAGSDKHPLTRKILLCAEKLTDPLEDFLRLGQPAPLVSAQARRPTPGSTISTPRSRRVSIFRWVTGFSYIPVFIAGQTNFLQEAAQPCGREHIVSNSTGKLCDDIGSSGRYHKQFRPFGQSHMLYIPLKISVKGIGNTLLSERVSKVRGPQIPSRCGS